MIRCHERWHDDIEFFFPCVHGRDPSSLWPCDDCDAEVDAAFVEWFPPPPEERINIGSGANPEAFGVCVPWPRRWGHP